MMKIRLTLRTLLGPVLLGLVPFAYGQFAYVANLNDSNISGYAIDPHSGVLTEVSGSPFATQTDPQIAAHPQSVVVNREAKFAYAPNFFADNISGFTIDSSTGALTLMPGSPFAQTTGSRPYAMTLSPNGKFAYVCNFGTNDVSAYTIDSKTGALASIPGSPFAAGTGPISVTVDPHSKFVYVTNAFSNNVSGYTVNDRTGALTPISGQPFKTGAEPDAVTITPRGKFAYVSNAGDNNILLYSIDDDSGALHQLGSPFPAGTQPGNLAITHNGRFAYTINFQSQDIFGYKIDEDSGVPTLLDGFPLKTELQPDSVALDASSKFLYVTSFALTGAGKSNVAGYAIDDDSGALTKVPGSPFVAGARAFWVGTTPVLPVRIDSDPASINLRRSRDIRVTIFSSPLFNARRDIDIDSLTFGNTGNERSLRFCEEREEDVNGDGTPDLICHFDARDAEFRSHVTTGTLKGKTITKVPILGTDSIHITSSEFEF